MNIITVTKGERELECGRVLRGALGGVPEIGGRRTVVVLPVPTSRDGVHLESDGRNLTDVISDYEGNAYYVGYGIPDPAAGLIAKRGGIICDASYDEDFLSENAELTARAMLGILLTDGGLDPSDTSYGIIGWGRIGSRLGALLLFLGASLTVFTTSEDKKLELGRLGIRTADPLCDGITEGLDVLINTAPSALVDGDETEGAGVGKIYDLASGNYLYGVPRVEKLPSLPAKYYPLSAARRYAEYAIRKISCTDIEVEV